VHVIRRVSRLDPEGASGPTLAGKAVTHGDRDRMALRFQTKLPTATGGLTGSHRHGTYRGVAFALHGSVSTMCM
jgi:hypothetical protein